MDEYDYGKNHHNTKSSLWKKSFTYWLIETVLLLISILITHQSITIISIIIIEAVLLVLTIFVVNTFSHKKELQIGPEDHNTGQI